MKPRIVVRLMKDRIFFGPGVEELLSHILVCGSIKNAARNMGMSYSKALRILNCAEEELGILLAYRYHGGSSGGKAEITPEGASFLQAYREYNQQIQQFAEQTFERYFAVKQLPPQTKDGE